MSIRRIIRNILKESLGVEDDFGWAKEIIAQTPIKYGKIRDFLQTGDEILVSGEMVDGEERVVFILEEEPFSVIKVTEKRLHFHWLNPIEKRPDDWQDVSTYHGDIILDDELFEYDQDLNIVLVKRNNPQQNTIELPF